MDSGNANVGVVGANQSHRFYVELKPGVTNIVSLKKLMREAGEEVSDYSSDENEAEKYIRVELSRNKKSGALDIQDEVQHKTGRIEYSESSNDQTKKKRKGLMGSFGEEDSIQVDTKPKKRGKQAALETAISVSRNLKSQEFNVRNDRCKGDSQNPLNSSGGVILRKHSDSSSRLNPGNNLSLRSAAHQRFQAKKSTQHELHSRSSMSKDIEQEGFVNIKQQNKKGRNELPYLNLPYTGNALRTASVHMTDVPKSGYEKLDWSILQLEKLVENSKTPLIEVQGADASLLDIEKQLSPELKEKLAKVARLTQLYEGKISEELIDRLMGILGKYLQRQTLKKILRGTVLEDLFASKAECNYFKQKKKDIVKMIRLQAPSPNVKVFPASEVTKGTYSMSDQLEDKLYDLYDAFSQGLDEDIGPSLVRKLYVKLAELWPKGTMDNHEIRKAICRAKEAKERKMVLSSEEKLIYKHNSSRFAFCEKGHQTMKKNKLSATTDETIRGKACSVIQTPAAYGNVTINTSGLAQTSAKRRMVSSLPAVDLPLTAPSSTGIPPKKLYRDGNVTTDTSGLAQTSAKRRKVSSLPTVDLPLTAPSATSIRPKKLYRDGNVTTDTSGLAQTSAKRRTVSSMTTFDLPLTASFTTSIPPKKLYRDLV